MPPKQFSKPPHFANGQSKLKQSFKAKVKSSKVQESDNAKTSPAVALKKNANNEHVDKGKSNLSNFKELAYQKFTTSVVAKKRKNPPDSKTTNGTTNGKQKGAKLEPMVPSKKFRTTNAESESNSEEDDYIHKFFADVKEDAAGTEEMYTTEEESEVEETSEDDSDAEEEEDNDEEEPMPIEALIEHYGKMRDVKKKQHLKAAAEKKSPTALKKNTSTTSMNSSAGWIEEDNDQDLQYESDGEGADSGQGVKQKSPSNGNVTSNGKAYATSAIRKHNTTYGNEQQDYDEDTDDFSGSDGLDDAFDTDDSEMWTDASENSEDSEESEDSGLTYLRQPYDSDSYDEDYDPSDSDLLDSDYEEDGPEDVYIPRGTAHIYDIDDDTVSFGEGMSQIIEIPNNDDEEWAKKSANTDPSSDTDIPPLVPIYDVHGEFIDSPEKLPKQLVETPATAAASKVVAPEKEAVETPEQQEAIETPEQQEAMESPEKEVMETPEQEVIETPEQEAKETVPIEAEVKTNGKQKENEDDSSSYTDEQVEREVEKDVKDCADPYVDEPEHTKFYRFYNAIDKRMTLAVLKNHIYFYGHLAVQALFGQVEIMGYRLETAETRTVTAARGYNAVSLIPLPSPESFNKAAFKNVLQKLRPHFIDIDMDTLLTTFDPSESVLVLLQAEPDGSTSLPVICNYLDEFNLFPTPISLRVQSSFSQTQQLLEVELLTPDVTKVRSVPLFQKNPIWDKVQLRKSSRLMVIGGKDAGKSTLCQFLINRHIREFGRIVLLDLDIGQPLVHLPETISVSVLTDPILGVGCFAKAQPPSQCLLFGSVNVVSSPVLYIKNVQQLVEHCEANAELKDVPWIVNTMGYTTGFGEELMAALIHLVQPTELIQLQIPRSVKGFNNYEHVHKDKDVQAYKFNILFDEMAEHLRKGYQLQYRFRKISVKYERPAAPLSSVKRRTLSIMTKLIGILNDETEWFTDVKPVCASLDDIQVLVMRDECMAPAKGILPNILNAMMVYLCEPMANGQQYICLGVGIVRAVDQNNMVHLLHSLPPEQLEKAKVLALCTTSLPDSIYLRLNAKMDGTIPYLQNVG